MLVSFEDLAVDITQEEWQHLDSSQKTLYKDVMMEIYNSLLFLGYCKSKPEVIFKLEQGAESWTVTKPLNRSLSGGLMRCNLQRNLMALVYLATQVNAGSLSVSLTRFRLFSRCLNTRIHIGQKPYEYKQCGKAFIQKSNLTSHQKIYINEKPYGCEMCGKTFRWKSNLTTHQGIHTGDKPFECNTCEKAFCRKSQLIVHQKIHKREKTYECSTCGKFFFQKSQLTLHKREKIYECKMCGKPFCWKSQLFTHQRMHRSEKIYEFNACGKVFYFRVFLRFLEFVAALCKV
ncbi:zinc finger protein 420-like [Lepus europaeus]|uniref:zinc finger protein 420-like n=1 Tax=Lepus europaeus TaxID=9983 RepID=UPI002B47990D|nr:zinc finger protein 420-like [Lepus europaeus]